VPVLVDEADDLEPDLTGENHADDLDMPSRLSISVTLGPPPCTTTGRMPQVRRNTVSSAKACLHSTWTMACAPYSITITPPWNSLSQGSASVRTAALARALPASCFRMTRLLPIRRRAGRGDVSWTSTSGGVGS
jgi:hypothetical protein